MAGAIAATIKAKVREGAAKTGGRLSRKGEPTLYVALNIIAAVAECMQGLHASSASADHVMSADEHGVPMA